MTENGQQICKLTNFSREITCLLHNFGVEKYYFNPGTYATLGLVYKNRNPGHKHLLSVLTFEPSYKVNIRKEPVVLSNGDSFIHIYRFHFV